jgi:hypothetical protein
MKRLAKSNLDFDLFTSTLMKKALTLLCLLSIALNSCQSSESTSTPPNAPVAAAPPAPVTPPVVTSAKFAKFNQPNELRNKLSMNGLGELHHWHNSGGEAYFMSITDDYEFGSPAASSLRNNMGYQLTGTELSHAQELELYLDIFNASERADALKRLQVAVGKTFQTLGIKKPNKIFTALKTNKPFTQEAANYTVKFYRDQSNIESWKLKITSK